MASAPTASRDTSPSDLLADAEFGRLDHLVDLDRYPLHARDSVDGRRLVAEVREALADSGCVQLDAFLRGDATERMSSEIRALAGRVKLHRNTESVYARADIEAELDPSDPRARHFSRWAGHVTRDMLTPFDAASQLYAAPAFKRFIAACVGRDRIFEYADPLAGLVATVLPPGGEYPWHYDSNEFVVTIMTQAPDSGGAFEYVPNLRSPGNENLEGLGAVLDGQADDSIRRTEMRPGDFQLFLGRYSLHRVAPTAGTTDRHVAVFSYADEPGVIGPLDRTRSLYGRVTEAHLVAAAEAAETRDGLIR